LAVKAQARQSLFMHIQIELATDDLQADVDNIVNLKLRLNDNLDPSAKATVEQQQMPLGPDDAAPGILTGLLNIIIGKKFLEDILEIIKEWIKSRPAVFEAKKPKLTIIIEEDGKKKALRIENIKDLEKVQSFTDAFTK